MVTGVSGSNFAAGVSATNGASNVVATLEGLWDEPVVQKDDVEKANLIELQIAQLNQQKSELLARRAELEAQLEELNQQKATLTQQKRAIEAEIAANEAKIQEYTQKVAEYNESLKQEKQSLQKLKAEYQQKIEKASELDKQLQAKISEVLAKSKMAIDDQKKKVDEAREEAYAKVASGELEESEVAAYIMNKIGGGSIDNCQADMAIINTLCAQLKANISDSQKLITEIGVKETNINKYEAMIASGDSEIQNLTSINAAKKEQLSGVNSMLSLINEEIADVSGEITTIDGQIVSIDKEIEDLNNGVLYNTSNQAEVLLTQRPKREIVIPSGGVDSTAPAAVNNNPFAVSFENVEYGSVVDALKASSLGLDVLLSTVQAQVNENLNQARNIFLNIA